MEQFKRTQVIMLPHNNINTIITKYLPNTLSTNNDLLQPHTNQHLYFLSDEKIEDGDWCYCKLDDKPIQYFKDKFVGKEDIREYGYKKIIATTDKLALESYQGHYKGKDLTNYIPQPSQQFTEKYIESYNTGKPITEVLVEYDIHPNSFVPLWQPKINPKNNTITIKKLKDSWNKEEVINIIRKHTECLFSGRKITLDEFIKENL